MLVAVVGGTGTLGRPAVAELVRRGHEVRILSRNPPRTPAAAVHRRVDLSTGAGLVEALAGAQAVIDASNAASPKAGRQVLVDGTRRLLAAEAQAGVAHHELISVVGGERVPLSYYRTKLAQEDAVRESGLGWSIVRATQFHDLLDWLFKACARVGLLPRSPAPLQPIDSREVAVALAGGLEHGPSTAHRELAGPEILTITELARVWAQATRSRRMPLPLPVPGAAGRALRGGGLLGPQAKRGSRTFGAWLDERYDDRGHSRPWGW